MRYTVATTGGFVKIAVALALIICGSALFGLPLLASIFHVPHTEGRSLACSVVGLAMVLWGAFDIPSSDEQRGEDKPQMNAD